MDQTDDKNLFSNTSSKQEGFNTTAILKDFVDFLLPELTPYEVSYYLYLFRKSYLENGIQELRVGKRTISHNCGKGSRSDRANFKQVTKVLKSLESKGCIEIGDTNREGTLYTVELPHNIPLIKDKINKLNAENFSEFYDYYNDPLKRKEIFERDKWNCQYCGQKVNEMNATLDHYIPISKNGKNNAENLKTSCLICNSIKSGNTFEEAAPLILKSIQERISGNNTVLNHNS